MEKPKMKPLVKRQDSLPQAGKQVIIYQNGLLLDQKYAGLFTCKLPSAAPPPPPPPPPPPAPSAVRETVFHIGYFQSKKTGLPQGAVVAQFKAAVFANNSPGIGEKIACHDQPTYRDNDFTIAERPKYPQKIPFDSPGRKGCEFNRLGDNDAGGLNCEGILAKCNKVPGDPERVDCKDDKGKTADTWRTQVNCNF
ncbi:MAG: hypothetical protein L6R42_004527 [Xanthoria sp. 1 TBL-2021]|nr:MAG: hypothetical protein L6R42_004527 [Xanthoria sp. 1 TBL-2021]